MLHRDTWSLHLRTDFFLTPANEAEYMMALQFLEERIAVINQHINGVLRGFSLYIIMYPPHHPPFTSESYTQTATFSPFPLPRPILMRIFAAVKRTIVDYPDGQRLLLSTDCMGFFYAHNLTYMAVAIP